MNKLVLKSFICSLPACMITYIYLGKAYHDANHEPLEHYELIPLVLPIIFAIFNYVRLSNPTIAGWKFGAGLGLTLSIIGRFGFDLPVKMFKFNKDNERNVHVYAMILYSMIFHYVIDYLNGIVIVKGDK